MNEQLQNFARKTIVDGLKQLPLDWQNKFKLMYCRTHGKRSDEDIKALTVEDAVSEVPSEKLDWAMQQVKNSIKKLNAEQS